MATTQLLDLAKEGDLEGFETRCLAALEQGDLSLEALVRPFELLQRRNNVPRIATLGQMVLENSDPEADPAAALKIARMALMADPNNEELRKRVLDLYRATAADVSGLDNLLEATGLASGRPARSALRAVELCLRLNKGDMLLSRSEDAVAQVLEINLPESLITLRRNGRSTSLTPSELSREYERVDANDFRVLRAQSPERLRELAYSDPVSVVVGILKTHDGMMDQETLRNELSPYLSESEWSKWWSKARMQLKRTPNITIEGRSPVMITYSSEGRTLEDETWERFAAHKDPRDWLKAVEGYLREAANQKIEPSRELLQRCHEHLLNHIRLIEPKRPIEAFACALVTEKLDEEAGASGEEAKTLAIEMLRKAEDPAQLIAGAPDAALWDLAISALEAARPQDAAQVVVRLFPKAAAPALDRLVSIARKGGTLPEIQACMDQLLSDENLPAETFDPARAAEVVFWLWRDSKEKEGLRAPESGVLFTRIIKTLSALGRSLTVSDAVMKNFRHRMKAALSLRDFARARECIANIKEDRGITLRSQLQRLEGLGEVTRSRLVELLRETHPILWRVAPKRVEPWEDPEVVWTTRAGLQRKVEERDHLVNVTMRENAKRIGEAASLGDLSENSEYKFALEERDLLRARLAQMNNDISRASPIEERDVPVDHVGVGSRVTLRAGSDGALRSITFLGPFDSDVERGIFNYLAPVAQRLMGLRVGETVKIALQGAEDEYTVEKVENGLG